MPQLHERLKNVPIPASMRLLPLDERGFPVPWFVEWVDGKPEFRAANLAKKHRAVLKQLCWVCGGEFTNRRRYFVIGPMCVLNRNTAEPPCHRDCAEFSVRGCPFLSMPKMVRRTNDLPQEIIWEEHGLRRNPGATAIYQTRGFTPYYPDRAKSDDFLIQLGEPDGVTWWADGREATRAQVLASIDSGLPLLFEQCDREETESRRKEARSALDAAYKETLKLLPQATR